MANKKISKKRKKSLKQSKKINLHSHKYLDETILTKKRIREVLVNALIEGDFDTLKDAIITQILISNKTELMRKSELGRQTLYDIINDKREFNPTIKTLSQLLKAFAA